MGKGADLAIQIIEMNKEYNRHVQSLYQIIDGLRDQIKYHKDRADNEKDYYNKHAEKIEKTLEAVTDIICHSISTARSGNHYINMWDDDRNFKKLIEVLGITLDVSKTESEDKTNED